MTLVLAVSFCLLASLLRLVPAAMLQLPAGVPEMLDYAVPALLLYAVVAAALQMKKSAAPAAEQVIAPGRLQEPPSTAPSGEKRALLRDLQEVTEEKEALQAALREAEARLKEAQALPGSGMQRDALIDAELVNLLALLQEKGRLIDFLMDDITAYQDAQVGAAARVVQQGCAAVIREYFKISPVHPAKEGEHVQLPQGFDAGRYRLVGRVQGQPPFHGTLLHHGWAVDKIGLPRVVKSGESLEQHRVLAPAEVELA